MPRGKGVELYGNGFESDNQLALFLLPDYAELVQSIRNAMFPNGMASTSTTVLDVGANVGQFAVAAKRFMNANVVSYEPNPTCWPIIGVNSRHYEDWAVVRKAVSETRSHLPFHFVLGKSAQGSFSESNAKTNLISSKNYRKIEVLSGPVEREDLLSVGFLDVHFNLVKIDVEGFELEALKGLQDISFSFLLVEIAEERDNGFSSTDVCDVAREKLGINLVEIFSDKVSNGYEPRNVLYKVA